MFTPTEQNIPGNTPIDPLRMQFLTNGQMQYMPQAQYMTPSQYGSFRTMPAPGAYTAPTDGGFLHNLNVANRGSLFFGLLPEYTINTYNPSSSSLQQQLYARRRIEDAKTTALASAADIGSSLGLGALGMAVGGIPGIALSFAGIDFTKPVTERLRTTREIQDVSTRKIFSGSDVDQALGYGFNDRAARSIDKFIRKEAADDRMFDKGDWQELLKLGTQFGQFDYANNAEQYKRILKNMRNSMSVMMEVLGSSDFKDVMENMKRMRDMGATMERYNQIAVEEQAYSRTLGLSHQETVNTYGKAGAVIYQQHGLNAMQGSLQNSANASKLVYLQRTGILDPITVAQYGGISGMAQEMTEQGAKAQISFKKNILPALMNKDMTGLRTDVDLYKLLTTPGAFNRLSMESAGRLSSKEQVAEYKANADKAWAELQQNLGTAKYEDVEMNLATDIGKLGRYSGPLATRQGLVHLGYGDETAKTKYEAYYNDDNRRAIQRAEDEARMHRMEEEKSKHSFVGKLEREWKAFWNNPSEWLFDKFSRNKFNTGEGDGLSQEEKDSRQTASPKIDRGDATDPTYIPSSQPYSGPTMPDLTPTASDADVVRLHNEDDGPMSVEQAKIYYNTSRALIKSETGKDWGDDWMKSQEFIDGKNGAMGGFQVTLARLTGADGTSILDTKYLAGARDTYFKGMEDDFALVKAAVKKYGTSEKAYAAMRQDPKVKAAIDRIHAAWKEAAKHDEFNAGVAGSIRHDIVTDRLNDKKLNEKYGDKLNLLKNNLATMKVIDSVANLTGTGTFREVMGKVLDKYGSLEELQKAISQNNGLDVAKDMMRVFYETDKVRGPSGEHRYNVEDSAGEYRTLEQEINGRKENKERAQVNYGFSKIATNLLNERFKGEYTHERAKNGARLDCSGFGQELFQRYEKATGGQLSDAMKKEALSQSPTAAGFYKHHLENAGGKAEYYFDRNKLGKKEAVDQAYNAAKVGDVLYFHDDLTDSTAESHNREGEVGHIGFVVDVDGEKYIAHKSGTQGNELVPLREALGWTGGFMGYRAISGLSVNSAFKVQGNNIPNEPTYQAPLNGDKAALDEAVAEAEKRHRALYDRSVPGYSHTEYGKQRDAQNWVNSETTAELGEERLLQDLGKAAGYDKKIAGRELDKAFTTGGEKSALSYLLDGGDWQQFIDYKNTGRNRWGEALKKFVRATRPDLHDEKEVEKEAAKLQQNDYFMRTMQATLMARYRGKTDKDGFSTPGAIVHEGVDYGALFNHAVVNSNDSRGRIVSRAQDSGNQSHNDSLLTAFFDNVLGIDDHPRNYKDPSGENKQVGDFASERFGDLDDSATLEAYSNARSALATAMSKDAKVKKTGLMEGQYYEQTANIMNLFHEYTRGGHSGDIEGKIREKLESLGKSAKIDPTKLQELLDNSHSSAEFATEFFKAAGLKSADSEEIQKLVQNLGKLLDKSDKKKTNINKLLERSSDTIGSESSKREMLVQQMQDTITEIEQITGIKYDTFHDKDKITDSQAQQALDLLRKKGYNSAAEVLQAARKDNIKVDLLALTRARNKAQAGNTKGQAPVVKPGQQGSDTGGGSAPGGVQPPVTGNVGPAVGGGFWDDPQVKSSMIELAPNIAENTKVLREVKTVLEQGKITPLPNGNKNN